MTEPKLDLTDRRPWWLKMWHKMPWSGYARSVRAFKNHQEVKAYKKQNP